LEGVTQLLAACDAGDKAAVGALFDVLYADLHRRARHQLRAWRAGQTLNTTALVNEAYLKLAGQAELSARDRGHFLAIAARAMRHIIVDHARAHLSGKRGGGRTNLTLESNEIAVEDDAARLVDLDTVLDELSAIDERLTRVVECRFFGGLTEEETAIALATSVRTVQRDWMRARGWLRSRIAL